MSGFLLIKKKGGLLSMILFLEDLIVERTDGLLPIRPSKKISVNLYLNLKTKTGGLSDVSK
jgi:hypothetical protein